MVKNSLYLMAMECDVKLYDEESYNKFIDSFKLVIQKLKRNSEHEPILINSLGELFEWRPKARKDREQIY